MFGDGLQPLLPLRGGDRHPCELLEVGRGERADPELAAELDQPEREGRVVGHREPGGVPRCSAAATSERRVVVAHPERGGAHAGELCGRRACGAGKRRERDGQRGGNADHGSMHAHGYSSTLGPTTISSWLFMARLIDGVTVSVPDGAETEPAADMTTPSWPRIDRSSAPENSTRRLVSPDTMSTTFVIGRVPPVISRVSGPSALNGLAICSRIAPLWTRSLIFSSRSSRSRSTGSTSTALSSSRISASSTSTSPGTASARKRKSASMKTGSPSGESRITSTRTESATIASPRSSDISRVAKGWSESVAPSRTDDAN